MTTEDQSLTDSVKPEEVTASTPEAQATPSTEAAKTEADKPSSSPENVTGKSDAEPESRANARIRQLVEERKQALAKLAEAEEQAKFFRTQAEALKPKPAGDEKDHPDQASYLSAKVREVMSEAQQAAAMQSARQAEALAFASRERAYQTRVDEFKEKASDYDQVVGNPNLTITPLMADAIKEIDRGPEVAFYLGKNPDEAARIARMSPVGQTTAIGKLSARLTLPEKRTTGAPPPVKTVSGGVGTAQPELADMSYEDYRNQRMGKNA
jgi:hypothetical protein